MKIRIKFHKKAGDYAIGKVIKADTLEEMRESLSEVFNDCNCGEVMYSWREDGICLTGLGDTGKEKIEKDIEKMLDMIVERVRMFGYCEIEGEFESFEGIGICDYENSVYDDLKKRGHAR